MTKKGDNMKTEIEENAKQIASLICEVDVDYRGDLFHRVGELLKMDAQGYTGSLLQQTASIYRLNVDSWGVMPENNGKT